MSEAHSKVLMLCYNYSPMITGGVERSVKLAKYIPRFGWEPVILTTKRFGSEPGSFGETIVRTPEPRLGLGGSSRKGRKSKKEPGPEIQSHRRGALRGLGRSLAGWAGRRVMIPDDKIRWALAAYMPARRLMRREGIDVIYSSSPPASAHLLGMWLKSYSGKPLILDLRDPWTFEPLNRYLNEDERRRDREMKLERQCFERADLIVINTPEAAERYGEIYPEFASKMQVITNGFDGEELSLAERERVNGPLQEIDSSVFVISHTGSFSRHTDRDISPEPLLIALSELLKHGTLDPARHRVVFAGVTGPIFKSRIDQLGLADLVDLTGTVSHIDAMRIIKRSNLLLLYDRSERAEYYVRGKLYEYLGAGKRILGIIPPGAARRLLESSGFGIFALPGSSEDIARALAEALDARDDPVPAPGFDLGIYDRKRIAERMAEYLDRLTGR